MYVYWTEYGERFRRKGVSNGPVEHWTGGRWMPLLAVMGGRDLTDTAD